MSQFDKYGYIKISDHLWLTDGAFTTSHYGSVSLVLRAHDKRW